MYIYIHVPSCCLILFSYVCYYSQLCYNPYPLRGPRRVWVMTEYGLPQRGHEKLQKSDILRNLCLLSIIVLKEYVWT